jgi:opacity protein-like surface antigen
MKKLILLALATLFVMTAAQAQEEETLLSNGQFRLTGFWFSATHQFAYHQEDFAMLRGGYGGFEFNRQLLVGWGRFNYRDIVQLPDLQTEYEMKFNGFNLGFTPQSYKAIHPRLNFLAGGGRIRLDDGNSDRVFVFQPSAGMELNVFRWFRLGLEGGYRFVSDNDFPGIDGSDFGAPFAQIDLKFGWSWGDW